MEERLANDGYLKACTFSDINLLFTIDNGRMQNIYSVTHTELKQI